MKRLLVALLVGGIWLSAQVTSIPTAGGTGTQGPAGPAGPTGPPGPAGADGAPGVPGYSPNTLLSGGGVAWTSGLDFTVSAATYLIGNVEYSSAQTDLTLSAAHATLNRFDVIAVNSSGAAVVIEGTPAEPALIPDVDPATQLYLTAIYIPATATEPANVALTDVYHEGTEWTDAKSGTPITLDSTNNPRAGTVCIEATSATTGNYVQFTNGTAVDLSTRNELIFYIRSKAAWPSTRSLQLRWYNTNTAVGSTVTLNESAFGFASATTGTYQQIVVPLSLFQASGVTLNRLRITVSGSGGTIGWYIDDVVLQGGISPSGSPANMSWKGDWNATAAYAVNDVVRYGGAAWIGILTSTNATPSASSTYWKQIVAPQTAVAYSSLPAAGVAGRLLLSTDSWLAAQDSGTAWTYYGPIVQFTPPPAISTWTQQNMGTGGLTEAYGGITMVPQPANSFGILYRAQPSTPYTITTYLSMYKSGNSAGCGLGWRENSSGKLILILPQSSTGFVVQNENANLTWNSTIFVTTFLAPDPLPLRLKNTGTTLSVWVSPLAGDWLEVTSVAVGAFITPDQVLFFCAADANPSGMTNNTAGTLLSWKEE